MKDKKKNIDGSLYYDKSTNRWRCQYYIFNNDTLKEVRKSKSFKTEKEARDFFSTLQYQKGNILYAQNNGIPLNLLIRGILERKFDTGIVSERTYLRTLQTIISMEKCNLIKKNIDEITSDELQMYLNSLKNYSPSSINKFIDQLNQAFKLAMNKGYIIKNPMFDIIKPKSNKKPKEIKALQLEEQQILTRYLLDSPIELEPYKNVFLIQMFMGLRIGEALALKTSDINLNKKILTVNKTLTRDKNNNVIMGDSTKTYAGEREIPIPEFLIKPLMYQIVLSQNNKDNLLFVDKKGDYMITNNANRILQSIAQKLGIYDISTHSLRHTYGTRCIEAGMRPVALQRLMGHTDVAITLNTYTTIFNKYKEQELEKVNNYYINNAILSSSPLLNPISNNKEDSELE